MKIIVCGAGVVGVTTAYYLRQSGHDVTVIERLDSPAEETSFANGGQISVGHSEPWAHPDLLPKLWDWLGKKDAPIRVQLQWDIHQWLWGLRFLRECTLSRAHWNTKRLSALGIFSRQSFKALREKPNLSYDGRQNGILHLYTQQAEFDAAKKRAELIEAFGIERQVVDADTCLKIEPALKNAAPPILGGTYTPDDESGDARLFTKELAKVTQREGVAYLFDTEIISIDKNAADRVSSVSFKNAEGKTESLSADVVVVAAGVFSKGLIKPLGLSIPVYPLKGYSATFEILDPKNAPVVSLTDENKKMVFSRYDNRYRAAGMAEIMGYDKTIEPVRCEAIKQRVETLFPGVFDMETASCWAGLRPATPTNVPVIAETPLRGLYLNTGHGTLGFTLSCGSARLLAQLINRDTPSVNPDYYAFGA